MILARQDAIRSTSDNQLFVSGQGEHGNGGIRRRDHPVSGAFFIFLCVEPDPQELEAVERKGAESGRVLADTTGNSTASRPPIAAA